MGLNWDTKNVKTTQIGTCPNKKATRINKYYLNISAPKQGGMCLVA